MWKWGTTMLKQTLIYTANNFQRKSRINQQSTVLAVKQTRLSIATNTIWCRMFVHRRDLHISQNVISKDKKKKYFYMAQLFCIRPWKSLLRARIHYATATGATWVLSGTEFFKIVLTWIIMQMSYLPYIQKSGSWSIVNRHNRFPLRFTLCPVQDQTRITLSVHGIRMLPLSIC